MKNLIFAIIAIASVTLFTSCDGSNDPGYEGPSGCSTGGGNNGGGGNGGGGVGSGNGGGINYSEVIDAYVYGLPNGGRIAVDINMDGSNDASFIAHQNLSGNLNSQCFNLCPSGYTKRAFVAIYWTVNAYGEWIQIASYNGCANF